MRAGQARRHRARRADTDAADDRSANKAPKSPKQPKRAKMSTNGVAPPRRHAAGPAMVLGLSGLDERARALAATAAASLSIAKLEPKDASTATHVVAPTVRRSLKILHAAARGAWVRATRDDRTRNPDHARLFLGQKLGLPSVVSRPTWRDRVPAALHRFFHPLGSTTPRPSDTRSHHATTSCQAHARRGSADRPAARWPGLR